MQVEIATPHIWGPRGTNPGQPIFRCNSTPCGLGLSFLGFTGDPDPESTRSMFRAISKVERVDIMLLFTIVHGDRRGSLFCSGILEPFFFT